MMEYNIYSLSNPLPHVWIINPVDLRVVCTDPWTVLSQLGLCFGEGCLLGIADDVELILPIVLGYTHHCFVQVVCEWIWTVYLGRLSFLNYHLLLGLRSDLHVNTLSLYFLL
jgi:hypothetical protein